MISKKNMYASFMVAVSLFFLSRCSGEKKESAAMPGPINRIVSLSPSITRQIIDLGAEDLLAGVTSYHPPLKKKVEIIGTLVRPNIEKIVMISPDIVLYSREDMAVQSADRLADSGLRIFCFERNSDFDAICANYMRLAGLIGKDELARKKIFRYRKRLSLLKERFAGSLNTGPGGKEKRYSLVVFISHKPMIVASGASYIGKIILDAGARNCFNETVSPFPVISMESLVHKNPDIILTMDAAPEYFFNGAREFSDVGAVKEKKVYRISPDRIAYYTPEDYVYSVEIISGILDDSRKK